MGTLLFGTQEDIRCIQHVDAKGPADESLCLGYKTSTHFFLAGIYVSDDGYVLGVETKGGGEVRSYLGLEKDEIERLQGQSLLPRPLPRYQLGLFAYAWGYSLWLILALTAAWYAVKARLKARRVQRRNEEADAGGGGRSGDRVDAG